MDNMTCDEHLETLIEQRTESLDRICSSIDDNYDDWLKEFQKFTKLIQRAEKTYNYGAVTKYCESASFKKLGYNKENAVGNVENELGTCVVNVKKEKTSLTSVSSQQSDKEVDENMPAPKMPPPKKKRIKKEKISNVIKVKQEPSSNSEIMEKRVTRSKENRTSDVILQNPVIPIIELNDSLETTEEVSTRSTRSKAKKKEEAVPIRSTRTRTKQALIEKQEENDNRLNITKTKSKRERSNSDTERKTSDPKRLKSNSAVQETVANISSHTEYEDAVSVLDNRPNATFVVANEVPSEQQVIQSTTVIVNKDELNQIPGNDALLTDDESIEEPVKNSTQKKKEMPNQVFSPYENSPVKKKVEAFEKFQKNENNSTAKVNTSKILKEIESKKGNVKEKAKGFVDNNPPSVSRLGKYIGQKPSMHNNSLSVSKLPTPKSGHDYKERELRRQEKEKELRKKEIMKQTSTEEKKKKYEEKVLKVQQHQKEVLEKGKEKALELQRMKEERYRMVLLQKEEKQRMIKEENERRRLLAKQRAEDKKKEEETFKIEEKKALQSKVEKNKNAANSTPIYLTQSTPPLPCEDCYDSDDERYNRKKLIPSWASKPRYQGQDYLQIIVGHKIKNTLFCCQSQNINLIEVFQRIDPKKLKRTSSACWEKPPRFTILSSKEDN